MMFAVPVMILWIIWGVLRKVKAPKKTFRNIWLIFVGVLAIAGVLQWHPGEHSIGNHFTAALITSSSLWFIGPFLILYYNKGWNVLWSIPATFIFPYFSVALSYLIMIVIYAV